MTVSKCAICVAGLILASSLGCKSDGGIAEHYGDAFYANSERMVANPDAGKEDGTGAVDFEGNTVETVLTRYRRGQVEAQTTNLPTSILQQAGSSKAK